MKTVKIVYESYDKPHDPAPHERTVSLTLEDKDADKVLSVKVPCSRCENMTRDSAHLYSTLWSMEYLLDRYMIFGCRVLRIYEEGTKA